MTSRAASPCSKLKGYQSKAGQETPLWAQAFAGPTFRGQIKSGFASLCPGTPPAYLETACSVLIALTDSPRPVSASTIRRLITKEGTAAQAETPRFVEDLTQVANKL